MHVRERQMELEAEITRLKASRTMAFEQAYGRATRVYIFALGGMICGLSIGLAGLTTILAMGVTLFGISAFTIGAASLYVGFRTEKEVRAHRTRYAQLGDEIDGKEAQLRSLVLQIDPTPSSTLRPSQPTC
mgnify:CR=1 FL=1